MAVEAAWAIVLAYHTRSTDVVFGVTRHGRHLVADAALVVGCLINTVPKRVLLNAEWTTRELVEHMHDLGLAARPHEQASSAEIQSWVGNDLALVESIVVFERYSLDAELKRIGPDFALRSCSLRQQSSAPFLLAASHEGATLDLVLEFELEHASQQFCQRMLARFELVLSQILGNPTLPCKDLDLCLPQESALAHRSVSGPWSGHMPQPQSLSALLDDVLANHALAIAYIDTQGRSHRYAELALRRDAWASFLERCHLATPSAKRIVAAQMQRSFDQVALQLACFKHGFVWVPVDPAWPSRRIQAVVSACAPMIVITDDDHRLDEQVDAQDSAQPMVQASLLAMDDTAYIIFTSGSTGQPKGVCVSHRALSSHAQAAIAAYGLRPSDRVLQAASPAFDVALEEVWPTLLIGATLVERPAAMVEDFDALVAALERAAVSVVNLPSAFFHTLTLHLSDDGATLPACVRLVVIGSEAASASSVRTFMRQHPNVRLFHAYGPTEATITCAVSELILENQLASHLDNVPIGRPLGDCRMAVLDGQDRLCAPGVVGELCVAGPQLAHGYLNDPASTASRFVSATWVEGLMYRTGDLACLREDGQFQFVGRVDTQVKVRGVRVEPSEIEEALRRHGHAKEVAVLAMDTARGTELIAYLVPVDATIHDANAIRTQLLSELPSAFVPSIINMLDHLPRLANGKVDHKRLLASTLVGPPPQRALQSPAGDWETHIMAIFTQLLAREDIDVDDNFFDIGGHSLLALHLHARLRQLSDTPIPLAAIYSQGSVRGLAALLQQTPNHHLPSGVALNPRAAAWLQERASHHPDPNPTQVSPLFLVCGVHLYAGLAHALAKDRPVLGLFVELEAVMHHGSQEPVDIQTLATAYLQELRHLQPKGPYELGGVSVGGVIAFEMAQQLRVQGEVVQQLFLLDAVLPRAVKRQGLLGQASHRLRLAVERAVPRLNPVSLAHAVAAMRNVKQPPTAVVMAMAQADQLRDKFYKIAIERYDRMARPYSGPCVLIRARDRVTYNDEVIDWDLGWAALMPDGAPVFGVAGDHLGILRDPGVQAIARIMREQWAAQAASRTDAPT